MRPGTLPNSEGARAGFTLIETALATVIVGVGVLALMQFVAAGTNANHEANELTTALNLARHIRELCVRLDYEDQSSPAWGAESGEDELADYDDVDDLNGLTFSPPIDARRQTVDDLSEWSQAVSVGSVDPDNLEGVALDASGEALRVSVTVSRGGQPVCVIRWIVGRKDL